MHEISLDELFLRRGRDWIRIPAWVACRLNCRVREDWFIRKSVFPHPAVALSSNENRPPSTPIIPPPRNRMRPAEAGIELLSLRHHVFTLGQLVRSSFLSSACFASCGQIALRQSYDNILI